MKILFSEPEVYYRNLGLINSEKYQFHFDGMKYYQLSEERLDSLFDVFVCFMYTMPHNVLITNKFNNLNKPTILIMDGIYDYSNATKNKMNVKYGVELYNPILQNILFCVGEFPSLAFENNKNIFQYDPARMITNKGGVMETPQKKRFLITTANNAYFDNFELNSLYNLLKVVISSISSNDVEFDIRIFDEKLIALLTPLLPKGSKNLVSGSFEDILVNYSHVITTPSSIIISSMYHNRSVAMLHYRDSPPSFFSAWVFSSKDTVNMGVRSFIQQDPQRMLLQRQLLNREMSGKSINNILDESLSEFHPIDITAKKENLENIMLKNMLESVFNFNLEYFFRKLYLKCKSNSIIRSIRGRIK